MIEENLWEIAEALDYAGGFRVVISVPLGEELAKKTFNPRLGIVGGISILGTTGIVEPMSEKALVDTIRVELRQKRLLGDTVLLTPGNYGCDFLKDGLGVDPQKAVQVSNFIGDAIDICKELSFRRIILVGHIGKLVKLAGNMMNTHSKYGDCRGEILCALAGCEGVAPETIQGMLDCVSCDEMLRLLPQDKRKAVLGRLTVRIQKNLHYRAGEEYKETKNMVHFVGAGCGAVDLITVRGARLLSEADVVIYAGSLVNPELLNYCKPGCEIHNSAKMTLAETTAVIVKAEAEGKTTVRLHTGDSSIYGAVREQFDELIPLGIEYDVTPGVSAFCGAAASLKQEFTLPEVSQTVIITRQSGKTLVPEKESIRSLAAHRATMCLYLSTRLTEQLQQELLEGGYPGSTPVAIVFKASWPDERIYHCTVDTLHKTVTENDLTRTSLIIVGDCMGEKYAKSYLYDPSYDRPFHEAATK